MRGRKDIEDYTSMPILGEIPLMKDRDGEQAIVVEENKTSSVAESFRLLRSNMDFVAPQARVVMFTSTMPGEGKSFVSRNFAVTLASTYNPQYLYAPSHRCSTIIAKAVSPTV